MKAMRHKKEFKPTKTVRPDYVLKDIKREERANLPPRMKALFWLHMKERSVPAWMFEDCKRLYPEYFEKDLKIITT